MSPTGFMDIKGALGTTRLMGREDPIPTPIEAVFGARVVNLSSAASLAFLVWDILITTDNEVELIWLKPWSVTKFLYFHIRYVPALVQIAITFVGTEIAESFHYTAHDCYVWQVFQGVASVSIIAAVDIILILRVYALYNGHWAIRLSVGCLFFMEVVCMIVGLALAIPGIRFGPNCSTTGVPQSLLVYAYGSPLPLAPHLNFASDDIDRAGSVLFQIILFLLTVVRFGIAVRAGWGRIPLVELIMRDGTWAFFVLVAIVIAEAGLFGLENHALAGVLYGWLLTTFSFVGYRVLLNLQKVAVRTPHPSTSRSSNGYRFSTVLSSEAETNQTESHELSNTTNRATSIARI
ncbi:hypothetical protein CCMSSC00406_0003740 [Pleurotus cornucopiae]|uniref:Uncharacterized protein n=1 Tax=Pleurotus cornucopiae TaxID=5321 RepID=A0ACB7IU93_PLECO|nr:hypothetical protein CCMSSC00406_0003740 [Pleurotus cornucopiae]